MYTSYYANKQQAVVGKDANVSLQDKEDDGRQLRPNVPRFCPYQITTSVGDECSYPILILRNSRRYN